MLTQFAAVLIFALVGAAFVFGNLLLGALARPRNASAEKSTVYECGEPTIGSAWIRYNSRFYTVALVYLLFDVEVVVLIPAAMVFREVAGGPGAAAALLGLLVFLGLLILGLAYEWRYGNLDWIHQTDNSPEAEAATERARQATPTGAIRHTTGQASPGAQQEEALAATGQGVGA